MATPKNGQIVNRQGGRGKTRRAFVAGDALQPDPRGNRAQRRAAKRAGRRG